jgi:signal transduction histidine kinase
MLTFSKEREPEKVESDLNETVADVVELMQSRGGEMGVAVEFVPDRSIPPASFDNDAMHRALLNIVTNAIDAAAERQSEDSAEDSDSRGSADATTDDGFAEDTLADSVQTDSVQTDSVQTGGGSRPAGRVVVATGFSPLDGWVIAVSDNGPGIALQDRELIFSLFESRKGARGTGLGLPVSDKIMREHGGRIEIADAPPPGLPAASSDGRGTCFLLHLPVAATATFETSA